MGFPSSFPKSSYSEPRCASAGALRSLQMKKLLELLLKKAGPEPSPVDKASASADRVCILSFGSNLCKPEAVRLLVSDAARFCCGGTLLSWN